MKFDRYTIEPEMASGAEGFWVIGHGTYDDSSVLAGHVRRAMISCHDTVEEAQKACPQAEVRDHSTKVHQHGESLGDISGLPDVAPDWFDPADAGERWDEDY